MAHRRRGRAAAAALAALLAPAGGGGAGPAMGSSWDHWALGNPNKTGAKSKKTAVGGVRPRHPGVPEEEYIEIEFLAEHAVANEKANHANRIFVKYLNEIKTARIQIFETYAEMKTKGKDKGKARKAVKGPGIPEVMHMLVALRELMDMMEQKLAAVRRAGGNPVAVPTHFYKKLELF